MLIIEKQHRLVASWSFCRYEEIKLISRKFSHDYFDAASAASREIAKMQKGGGSIPRGIVTSACSILHFPQDRDRVVSLHSTRVHLPSAVQKQPAVLAASSMHAIT